MRGRWWYRGEKDQTISKTKLFFLKPLNYTQEVLKQILCFQPIFLRGLLSLSSRGCYGMLWDIVTKIMF